LKLPEPGGVLTQDGINLTSIVNLPSHLKLGIGYLYNVDLCGKHRFSLNAARDGVVFDEHADKLFLHLYERIGGFLGQWFREERVSKSQVAEYLRSVPRPLAEYVERGYKASR
jgi:hypothetical protein